MYKGLEVYFSEMAAVLSFKRDIKDRLTAIKVLKDVLDGEDKDMYDEILSYEMKEILKSALSKFEKMSDDYFKEQLEGFNQIGITFEEEV